jgi:hypothetical protein
MKPAILLQKILISGGIVISTLAGYALTVQAEPITKQANGLATEVSELETNLSPVSVPGYEISEFKLVNFSNMENAKEVQMQAEDASSAVPSSSTDPISIPLGQSSDPQFTAQDGSLSGVEPSHSEVSNAAFDLQLVQSPADPTPSPTTPSNPETEISQTTTQTRYRFSYIGIGANIGITGDPAIGETSFAITSKFAFNPFISIRPGIFIEDEVSFLIPVTYEFPITRVGEGIVPFVGGGIEFSTGDDSDVGLLLTTGIDVPINEELTFNTTANISPFGDNFDFGLLFAIAYTFDGEVLEVEPPDVRGAISQRIPEGRPNNPSFFGIGANLGIGGDTALGDTSFGIFSKITVFDYVSVRPGLLIEDGATLLLPVTYDFFPIQTDYITLAPYLGAGILIDFGDDSEADLLLTGGFDIPITTDLAFTTGLSAGVFDTFDIGAQLGLVYTFQEY